MTPEQVLYGVSRTNLVMMGAAAPKYNSKKAEEKPDWDSSLDANNPENNIDITQPIRITSI